MRNWLKRLRQHFCGHLSTETRTAYDPDSTLGMGGWATEAWKCDDCGLERHQIVPAGDLARPPVNALDQMGGWSALERINPPRWH